jgi:adenylosuccinate synthase
MNLVVVGAQWGDEGKGKIVDFLAKDADIIIRFSGGANAGHTIVHDNKTYKLHLIPSGIVYSDKTVILGSGMVIDPEALFQELATLSEMGVHWDGRVLISERAHLVLPAYRRKDKERDSNRDVPLGTTGRGIGISYANKASRDGIRLVDMFDENMLRTIEEGDREFLEPFREKLQPMLIDITSYLSNRRNTDILFEGAQGILLDLDCGTYPFVSSGISSPSGAAVGGGIGPRMLDKVIGVFKAYSTRVGNGPFPTEFSRERDGSLEDTIRELGREYGVTTGRPRRCGYLDLVALRYACRAGSIDSLALTHLDVYDSFDEISCCVSYQVDGREITDFPASIATLEQVEPLNKTFPGWKTSLAECRSYDDLPDAARAYIEFIESFTGTPVNIISVGYERNQTILRKDPWTPS